jgi:DeoR/GlpR family transcriptional regulator of sugar metabolism
MREQDESQILDLLQEKKTIHYTELVSKLHVSLETARSRCVELSLKYPKNVEYIRGLLRLKKSFSYEDLPLEKRLEMVQKSLEAKTQAEKELKEKLSRNHLPHLDKAVAEGNLQKIHEEIEKLKQLLGV